MKLVLIFFILVNYLNAMNCSDYKDFQLFNGHYYSVSIDKLTFDSAKQIAINNGGYLAIPNTQAENDFIKTLIGGGSIAWIGIHDPNKLQNYCYGTNCAYDSSRFKDVKNNSLLYKNFYPNQPDNLVKQYDVVDGKQMVSPLGEHWVAMDGNNGKWHDFGNHADAYNNPVKYKAVFEFDNLNECKPLTDDGVQELTGRFCNTKIWDSTIDTLAMGQTLDCQIDTYGNEYCPSALSQCGQSWDYENGYSVSGIGQVVDYTNKVSSTTYQNPIYNLQYKVTYARTAYDVRTMVDWTNIGTEGINVAGTGADNTGVNGGGAYCDSSGNCSGLGKVYLRVNNGSFQYKVTYARTAYDVRTMVDWTNIGTEGINVAGTGADNTGVNGGGAYCDSSGNCSGLGKVYLRVNNGSFQYKVTYARTAYDVRTMVDWTNIGTEGINVAGTGADNTGVNGGGAYCDSSGNCSGLGKVYLKMTATCSSGTLINGQCATTTLNCLNGYTATTGAETAKGQCKRTQEYTYYNYLCNNNTNTQGFNYTPINSGGNTGKIDPNNTIQNDLTSSLNSSTPPTNNCKRQEFTCLANAERPCSYVDNKWQCSPFPCLGQSNLESLDTQVGSSDENNNGWTEDGSCAGTIYIFNGKSNKCRTWDMFFGLIGGGCCDKEKVFAGLVACKENEKVLAKKREQKQAYYIGNFCSKKLKLGFVSICVQKSDSYCTFNSSLGKIIQEQGREQLGISWGSPENPQCRGFTPEEFQKIDFSKIDLTEFVKDIQSSVQTSVIQNLGTYVKDKVGDFYGN